MIDLRKAINRKKVPENENPNKIANIVEKILDFNRQQKGKGIKNLTPKQMLQRLPTAIAHVKASNISENLLIEIRQILYFLYQENKITKKVYNNEVIKQNEYYIIQSFR